MLLFRMTVIALLLTQTHKGNLVLFWMLNHCLNNSLFMRVNRIYVFTHVKMVTLHMYIITNKSIYYLFILNNCVISQDMFLENISKNMSLF